MDDSDPVIRGQIDALIRETSASWLLESVPRPDTAVSAEISRLSEFLVQHGFEMQRRKARRAEDGTDTYAASPQAKLMHRKTKVIAAAHPSIQGKSPTLAARASRTLDFTMDTSYDVRGAASPLPFSLAEADDPKAATLPSPSKRSMDLTATHGQPGVESVAEPALIVAGVDPKLQMKWPDYKRQATALRSELELPQRAPVMPDVSYARDALKTKPGQDAMVEGFLPRISESRNTIRIAHMENSEAGPSPIIPRRRGLPTVPRGNMPP